MREALTVGRRRPYWANWATLLLGGHAARLAMSFRTMINAPTPTAPTQTPRAPKSKTFLSDSEELQGPESLEELGQWDTFVAKKIVEFGSGHAQRAMENMKFGLAVTTDYSGVDFPRESLRIVVPALAEAMGIDAAPAVHFLRSCDIGVRQQEVLLAQAKQGGAKGCVFGSITDRIPRGVRSSP